MKGSDKDMMKKLSAAVLALVMAAGSGAALIGSADELDIDTNTIEVITDTAEDVQRTMNDELSLTLPTDDSAVTPDTPSGLKATKTAAGLKLTWNKVSNCEGYYIYRQHPNGDDYGYNFVYLTGNDSTTYVWNDYTDSLKNWEFAVVAYNREGSGYVFSDAALVTEIIDETAVSTGAPATPVFTSYNKTYDAVRLFWNPVACSGYEVEFNTNTGYWVSIGTVSSSSTNVRISKLNTNTTYSFRMRAYNLDASGNKVYSDYTPTFNATTTAGKAGTSTVSAPAKTTITRADTTANQITYHWNAVTCDGYQVYYNTTGNSSDWKLAGNYSNSTTSYTVTGLSANTNVWVTVRAFNKDSSGNPVYAAWADNYKATTGSGSSSTTTTAPAKVAITKIGRSTNAFRTYWNAVACDGYQLYINQTGNSSDWKLLGSLSASTTNYRIEGLQANHDYWVTLRAFNKKSDGTYVYGAFADNVKVTTKASSSSSSSSTAKTPAKVVISKTSKSYDAIRVNWNAMSVGGYEVYLNSTGNSGDWKQVATLAGTATTCRISGLTQGHTYWVTIRAFNKDSTGKAAYGAYADNQKIVTKSRTSTATNANKPAATYIYKTSASKNAVRLNWNVQQCDGYLVYMLQNNTWKLVKGIRGSGTYTYRKSGLYSGTTYFFKVKTFNFTTNNKKVVGNDSNIVSVTTKK